jgi:hypothetical protein
LETVDAVVFVGYVLRVFYAVAINNQMVSGRWLRLATYMPHHVPNFFAGVLQFSLEMYDLQLSLFDCLMVRRAFALVILIAVNFESKGLRVKSLTACFLLSMANLQSSLNQDLCLGLSLLLPFWN